MRAVQRPPRGPGIAHAERRALRLLDAWSDDPDSAAIDRALDVLLDPSHDPESEACREALRRLAPPDTVSWRAYRARSGIRFRGVGAGSVVDVEVPDDTQRIIVTKDADASASEVGEPLELRDAVDAVSARVLRWLRRHGVPMGLGARLATLFAVESL